MATIRLDPWRPDYGADVEPAPGVDEPTAAVDPDVETSDWSRPLVPEPPADSELPEPLRSSGPLFFVDGVRRTDARLLVEEGERRAWGIAASYAVGAVASVGGRAVVERALVDRVLVVGGGVAAPPVRLRIGWDELRYRPISVAGDDPAALELGVQHEMRQAEGSLAASLAGRGLVVADGPLTYPLPADATVVGVAKRMVRTYLGAPYAALLPRLEPGARSPLFAFGNQLLDRYAWYIRLVPLRPTWHELAGLVRCEVRSGRGLAVARAIADRVALELPRYAGRPGLDPRAPQNLAPIGALEADLRRRLGDGGLVRRALESELARAVGRGPGEAAEVPA